MLRLRASVGRAFRVPTFTERYYSDPANLARADVGPETAWAGEGGADVLFAGGWILQATIFGGPTRTSSIGCVRRPPIAGGPTTSATSTPAASSSACARRSRAAR